MNNNTNNIQNKEWFDDYDLLKSFLNKEVIIIDKKMLFKTIVTLPTIKDFITYPELVVCLNIFKQPIKELIKGFDFWNPKNYLEFVKLIYFEFNNIIEFQKIYESIDFFIHFILQKNDLKIDNESRNFYINNYNLDNILWDYILYIIWISFGEKRDKPKIFNSEAEEEFFKLQKESEDRIKQIRSRGVNITNDHSNNKNQLLSVFSVIMYSFKQLDFNFLFNCTNAQINWLYQQAYKIANYEVEAKAFAAGNMKKKLKFFTEK